MATIKELVNEVILEKKEETLKIFYDINIKISEREEEQPETIPPEEDLQSAPPETAEVTAEESVRNDLKAERRKYLIEEVFTQNKKGESTVNKNEALNIQTVYDLISFMTSDKPVKKPSIVQKALGDKTKIESNKILSEVERELIFAFLGTGQLSDIISTDDKVLIEIKYGISADNNIGFRINKNSGTDAFETVIVKDNEVLPGKLTAQNINLINEQILYFRNSIVS